MSPRKRAGARSRLARPVLGEDSMSDGEVSPEHERHRRALLSERLAAVGSLADGLAHEIHNPLNCALLQLAVLKRRLELPDCQPAAVQPVAELVEQALRRLELLFNDFVSFSQPRALERAPRAIADPCRGLVTLVRAEGDQVRMRVTLDLTLDLPPIEGGVRVLLAQLWPGPTEMTASVLPADPTP
jgi:two-component system NtrC family sensor kinase